MKIPFQFLPLLLAGLGLAAPALGQEARSEQGVSVFTRDPAEALELDARIIAMEAAGDLERLASEPEALASGWYHERFQRRYRGLRVFGDHLLRHWHGGRVVLVNGHYQDGVDLDTTPGLGAAEVRLAMERVILAGLGLLLTRRGGLRPTAERHLRYER